MFYADRVRETTTTTGTGTITLAGAVAQYQTFTSRVFTGDQLEYVILDANGTGFEVGQGTMVTTSTMSRDTVYQSSNSDALITLTAGTHKVYLTYSAQGGNKRMVFGDVFIDYIVSGLVLPASSGTLAGTLTAGVAYVIGQRVVKGAQANTYTASRDTYVDLSNLGVLTYAAVTNGAGAPALTANSIRLGKVVTGGSTITSATQGAKDSLGNWMGNTIRSPYCELTGTSGSTGSGAIDILFGSGTTQFDNQNMHSETTNTARATVVNTGLYFCAGTFQIVSTASATPQFYCQLTKNGSTLSAAGASYAFTPSGAFPILEAVTTVRLVAGDYIGLNLNNGGASTESYSNCGLRVMRIG